MGNGGKSIRGILKNYLQMTFYWGFKKDWQSTLRFDTYMFAGKELAMRKIDTSKLVNAETVLTEKYGAPCTESRKEFEEKSKAYYYGVILRDRRKELKITQQQLAEQVGTARSYIAKVEPKKGFASN